FGDLDDPESEISKAIVAHNALPLAGNLTESKIFYVR
ncbi:MAG: 4Fe-4S ferredoxin, partial [Berryella intestinalis]|nr:4Fe-4S ferredoxin [Berryella intestinalis]